MVFNNKQFEERIIFPLIKREVSLTDIAKRINHYGVGDISKERLLDLTSEGEIPTAPEFNAIRAYAVELGVNPNFDGSN